MADAAQVIRGEAKWSAEVSDALEWLNALPDRCASLVFFSPPYGDQRTYGIEFKRTGQKWVDWLNPIVEESARVSAGLVIVNAAGPCKDHKYQPIVEWLVADLTRKGGLVCGPSPYAWVKSGYADDSPGNGIFGSGGERYQRRDWEPLYTFCLPDRLPLAWTDNTAFGAPPRPSSFGGKATHRDRHGARANVAGSYGRVAHGPGGKIVTNRKANGERKQLIAMPPELVNPGNVIRAPVGGGKCGHPLAHDGEAPMSLHVAERCICWFAAPDSIVCDPFTGTGTTCHAAANHGRRFIGCDVRDSQVRITERRMSGITQPLFA